MRNLDRSLRAKVFSEQRIFKAKVASIIDQDSWKWHWHRNSAIMDIISHTPVPSYPVLRGSMTK